MRPFSLRPSFVLAGACLLAVLLFPLVLTNSGVYFWGRFLIPIAVVYLWGRRRDIYIVAALAIVLIAAGYWFETAPGIDNLVVHHVLPIAVVWAAAWLLTQQKRLHEEMEAQVKARTAALAAREEQLAKIFRANPGGIAITRRADGCFVEANDAYLAMVGYTRAELIGHTILELGILSAESRAEVLDAVRTYGHLQGRNLQLTNANELPIANAFTPNGDGHNDDFGLSKLAVLSDGFKLWIYDRWGKLLFYTTDPQLRWNGTFNGTLQPAGTYVFQAEFKTKCLNDETKLQHQQGTVVLIR